MNFHVTGIWGWLLRPLFALCMLGFAAGSAALGGDGGLGLDMGGTDGGEGDLGADGEGAGGDEFGDGSEQDGDHAGDIEEGGADLEVGAGRNQLTAQQRAEQAREARLPQSVKKALAAVKETDPKTAQILRSAIFATQAWQQVMPGGIRQAREMATAFDEVGGIEGIQGLRDEAQNLQGELDKIDQRWMAADPEFFAELAEDDPEAFSQATPVVLEQLRKTDKAGYNALMGRIFYNTLNSAQVVHTIQQLHSLAVANKTAPGMAGVIEGLQGLWQWSENIRELAMAQPEHKTDKGLERLKAREKEFENKQLEGFKKDVGSDVKRHLESGILREVGKLLKAHGVNLAQLRIKEKDRFESMVAEADRQLTQAIMRDKPFHQQKDRLMQTKDKDRVLRLYQQKIDYLLADARGPRIASKVAKIFFSGIKPAPRPGGERGQNGGQGGDRGQRRPGNDGGGQGGGGDQRMERVSKQPDPSQIDWSRTPDSMLLDGEAWLKSGKQVKWR